MNKIKVSKPKIVREINRKAVIDILRNSLLCTKAHIGTPLNVSKQTINTIINSLVSDGLVIKVGFGKSTQDGGKKPMLYKFNHKAKYVIGTMLSQDKINIVLTDLNANILEEKIVPILKNKNYKSITTLLIKTYKEMISELKIGEDKLIGIGIGLPGLVDFSKGIVSSLPRFPDWNNIPLSNLIEKEMGVTCCIDNENRMMVYGEKWFGLAKNSNNFLVISTGKSIGCGIFINGKCIPGNNILGGELGHLKLKEDGPECICGDHGCLEALVNTDRVNQIIAEKVKTNKFKNSLLLKKYIENNHFVETIDLFNCFFKGDALSKIILDEIIYWFGIGLKSLVSILDPELIIINGEYVEGKDYLKNKVTEIILKHNVYTIPRKIDLKYSNLKEKAELIGAIGIVLEKVL